jgi:hypothetical protein
MLVPADVDEEEEEEEIKTIRGPALTRRIRKIFSVTGMEWAAWKTGSAPGGVRTNLTTINANTAPLRLLEFNTGTGRTSMFRMEPILSLKNFIIDFEANSAIAAWQA